jgi:hypothetical protein
LQPHPVDREEAAMAWACVHTIEGGHLEEYDKVNAEISDLHAEGLILHVACPIDDGCRLIDVTVVGS